MGILCYYCPELAMFRMQVSDGYWVPVCPSCCARNQSKEAKTESLGEETKLGIGLFKKKYKEVKP